VIVATAVAALSLAVVVPAASAASLAGWWSLNEGGGQTAYDWSGKGNHGKLGSTDGADAADPSWVSGVFGKALSFGGDDYVRIPDSPALEPENVTVSAFFRAPASPGKYRYIVSKGAAGCKAASYGLYSGRKGGLGFYISDGRKFAVSPLAPTSVWDDRWHHVVGTFNGATVRLFVDGREVGSGTKTSLKLGYGLPQSDGGYLGGYRGSCDLLFQGQVDEISIWRGAMPIAQLLAKLERRR
jgi:hypothetical protein